VDQKEKEKMNNFPMECALYQGGKKNKLPVFTLRPLRPFLDQSE